MTTGKRNNAKAGLVGTPSDATPAILTTGRSDITTLFVSMARKHPDGADADYLRWHTLDHRPEQQRLASLRTSLRIVSTPACRAARAASDAQFDAIDHVMTYFFTGIDGLEEFNDLAIALRDAGRSPFILTPVQRGVYMKTTQAAAPRVKIGADVLPWWPAKGVYLLIEASAVPPTGLVDVPGIGGVWAASSLSTEFSSAGAGQQITYCFLDDDPVATAARLRPILEQRWQSSGTIPLFAAPFYTIVPYEWDRYLP